MTDSLKTLLHPFETGEIDWPQAHERALLVNAPGDCRMPAAFAAQLTAVQDFRPSFLALQDRGHDVSATPQGEGYDLAILFCGRHRGQNEAWLCDMAARVRQGGRILVAGGKTDGAASLARRVGAVVALAGRVSKHHGLVFWFSATAQAVSALGDAMLGGQGDAAAVEGFETAPGMFSHDRVDAGSALLVAHLPARLSGDVADFGAGWGYLSAMLAAKVPAVSRIDLYEASHAASQAARRNMASLAGNVVSQTFWHCVEREETPRRYDAVIMNPPFHHGRAADPALGASMIAAASRALRPRGGRLLLVANRALPYEKIIAKLFTGQRQLALEQGFKVIEAWR